MSQDKMKKIVLKMELYEEKTKQKAMKIVSGLSGVDSIAMDMKDKKLTITGDIDPVNLVPKLRKLCRTEILTIGPAKEPEKKKDEAKKEEQKKTDNSKDKKADDQKKDAQKAAAAAAVQAYPIYYNHYPPPPPPPYYQAYNYNHQPQMNPSYYATPVEEDPSSCVIC